jgi:aminoglycoside 6'-N-acetyltransferase I
MRIADLDATDESLLEKLAVLTHEAGAIHFPNWLPTMEDAREEVCDATAEGHITRVLLDDDAEPLGWVSCVHAYGHVWEIHPLLVRVTQHRRGYGARLLADIELLAAARGAGVLIVGTADETGATSLGGVDLYLDPIGALANLTADPSHPVGFWLHMGYSLVGVTPDAEGPGLPTLNLAKRPPSPAQRRLTPSAPR